jgi:RNA polymerase sigma factor (sigma-70 family)
MPKKKSKVIKKPKKVILAKKEKKSLSKESLAFKVIELQKSKDTEFKEKLFKEIVDQINPLITKIVNKFNISGYDQTDLYQEALMALRFKAIKDFKTDRIIGDDMIGFEKFAALCTKRHLSTLLKTSFQNKKFALNSSISIHTESKDKEDNFNLSDIIDSGEADSLERAERKEEFRILLAKLIEGLSHFEKKVLMLYAQKFSYKEISDFINSSNYGMKVNIKGVDNALSRIKSKAKDLLDKMDLKL